MGLRTRINSTEYYLHLPTNAQHTAVPQQHCMLLLLLRRAAGRFSNSPPIPSADRPRARRASYPAGTYYTGCSVLYNTTLWYDVCRVVEHVMPFKISTFHHAYERKSPHYFDSSREPPHPHGRVLLKSRNRAPISLLACGRYLLTLRVHSSSNASNRRRYPCKL